MRTACGAVGLWMALGFLQTWPRERIKWWVKKKTYTVRKPTWCWGIFVGAMPRMPCSWGHPGHDSVVTSTKVCLFQLHEIWQLRFYVIHLAGPRRLESDLLSLNWGRKGGKRQRQDNSNNNMIHWFIDSLIGSHVHGLKPSTSKWIVIHMPSILSCLNLFLFRSCKNYIAGKNVKVTQRDQPEKAGTKRYGAGWSLYKFIFCAEMGQTLTTVKNLAAWGYLRKEQTQSWDLKEQTWRCHQRIFQNNYDEPL